jgi:hypothetical protein
MPDTVPVWLIVALVAGALANPSKATVLPCVNPVTLGADPTGAADSAPAVNSALSSLGSQGGCLNFPAGKFKFLSAISYTFTGAPAGISVFGAGIDATILYWPNSYGMAFNYAGPADTVHIHDLTFSTGAAGTNTAVFLNQPTVANCNSAWMKSDIHHVTFRGDDNIGFSGNDYWNIAYLVSGVSATSVDSVTVWGAGNPSTLFGYGGIYRGSSTGPCFSVVHDISKTDFNNLNVGVSIGEYTQGVTITQTNFTSDNNGIVVPANITGLAQLTVESSQFASRGNDIEIDSPLGQTIVIGNNFFVGTSTVGVNIKQETGFQIIGNIFTANTTGAGDGVQIGGNGGASIPGTVQGNTFVGMTYGVALLSSSTGINVQGNSYWNCTTQVIDAGSGNSVGVATK